VAQGPGAWLNWRIAVYRVMLIGPDCGLESQLKPIRAILRSAWQVDYGLGLLRLPYFATLSS